MISVSFSQFSFDIITLATSVILLKLSLLILFLSVITSKIIPLTLMSIYITNRNHKQQNLTTQKAIKSNLQQPNYHPPPIQPEPRRQNASMIYNHQNPNWKKTTRGLSFTAYHCLFIRYSCRVICVVYCVMH